MQSHHAGTIEATSKCEAPRRSRRQRWQQTRCRQGRRGQRRGWVRPRERIRTSANFEMRNAKASMTSMIATRTTSKRTTTTMTTTRRTMSTTTTRPTTTRMTTTMKTTMAAAVTTAAARRLNSFAPAWNGYGQQHGPHFDRAPRWKWRFFYSPQDCTSRKTGTGSHLRTSPGA